MVSTVYGYERLEHSRNAGMIFSGGLDSFLG